MCSCVHGVVVRRIRIPQDSVVSGAAPDCIFIIPGQQRTKRWGESTIPGAAKTRRAKRSAVNSDALEFMQQILTYHTHTHSSESCRINPSKGTQRQGQPNDPQPPDLCLASKKWQQNSLAEPATVTVAQMGVATRLLPPSAATPTFASTVWALAAGQPQPGKSAENSRVRTRRATQKNAACTSVSRRKVPIPILVLAILFIFSQAALYLSAAVLVGEIVCNHENLISAQICWHCANVFYGPSRSNFRQFSSVWLGSATRKGAAPSLKMTDCWSGGLGP